MVVYPVPEPLPPGQEDRICGLRGAGGYDCVGGVNTQDDATHAGPELPPQWFPSGR